jgi:aminopeptidase N
MALRLLKTKWLPRPKLVSCPQQQHLELFRVYRFEVLNMSEGQHANILKESEAKLRCKQVANVRYDLSLHLKSNAQEYNAEIKIAFDFRSTPDATQPLFLDYVGQKIHQIHVNGTPVTLITNYWRENRIYFPNSDLRPGGNEVIISYTNTYNHDGQGFHQFTDPEDNQEYLYTNFEPFDAHKLFPCFDQPNIKGHFKLCVTAPSLWKILSNMPCAKTSQPSSSETLHQFEESPLMSTYLFAIVAGPYQEWRDSYNNEIPLGLYARKSLAKHLEYEEIFEITKAGLKFYSSFFDFPYPFKKYDQVFAPEFNQGAMENIGLVTYREDYVFKDPPTTAQRAYRADTILHEMAHMWFGNLVTPVWWDGLWLNESFATYMAALCVAEATKWHTLSWTTFNSSMKEWAYREDQQSTTHPIQGDVPDTDATLLNFDGITYGKGASLLKQLVAIVGMDGFKRGMQYYFKKFQWGNTTIEDFLLSLQSGAQATGRKFDAREWALEWLCTAGLNTLTPKYSVNDNKIIDNFVIVQEAPSQLPTLRHHHLEIALFDVKENSPVLRQTLEFDVLPQKETLVSPLVGQREPNFVFLNFNDYAFAKCLLDPKSEKCARQYLEKFEDPLLRQMLWSTTYTMVRDQKLPVQNYLELVRSKIGFERDAKLVSNILNRAQTAAITFLPESLFQNETTKLFRFAFEMLQTVGQDDFRIPWAHAMITFACTKESVSVLANILLQGDGKVGVYTLDQKMRWSIVEKTVAWNLPESTVLLEKEKERDRSDRGERAVRTAMTSQWNAKVKEEAWNRYLNKNQANLSVWQIEADMAGFMWRHQSDILTPYVDKFFAVVRSVFKEREKEFASAFFAQLFPFLPEDPTVLARTENLINELQPDEQVLLRFLKETLDDLKRARACRQLSLTTSQST